MTLGNIQPFPIRSVRRTEAADSASLTELDPAAYPEANGSARMRKDASNDFNPLMERAIRAQRLAEGRRYSVPISDTL